MVGVTKGLVDPETVWAPNSWKKTQKNSEVLKRIVIADASLTHWPLMNKLFPFEEKNKADTKVDILLSRKIIISVLCDFSCLLHCQQCENTHWNALAQCICFKNRQTLVWNGFEQSPSDDTLYCNISSTCSSERPENAICASSNHLQKSGTLWPFSKIRFVT